MLIYFSTNNYDICLLFLDKFNCTACNSFPRIAARIATSTQVIFTSVQDNRAPNDLQVICLVINGSVAINTDNTEVSPRSLTRSLLRAKSARPPKTFRFPKSPACLSSSLIPPWFFCEKSLLKLSGAFACYARARSTACSAFHLPKTDCNDPRSYHSCQRNFPFHECAIRGDKLYLDHRARLQEHSQECQHFGQEYQ